MYRLTTSSGKHVMLSYQWDNQHIVEQVYEGLNNLGIKTWMDVKGGMKDNVIDSMAFGVENASVVCCFLSAQYQNSKNCKKELSYADEKNIPIVPVMLESNWKATQWLGLIIAGLLWIDFRTYDNVDTRIESLAKEIVHRAGNKRNGADLTMKTRRPKTAGKAQKLDLEKKPGRAFRHVQTGKYLAELTETQERIASGVRSTLVLRSKPEATSYWIEERKDKESGIMYYKNYESKCYLGYDPNGDYTYTNGQPYGAEEWLLMADESSHSGERSIVIFANYGQKYLAVQSEKLTGVSDWCLDCVWTLT